MAVRQVVAEPPAPSRPHVAPPPLPALHGPAALGRGGLSPPRTGTCPAYYHEAAGRRGQLCRVLADAGLGMASPARLLYVEQLDLEDQRRVGRDHAASAARAVAERRPDR